jgi:protein-disulfide isomerase
MNGHSVVGIPFVTHFVKLARATTCGVRQVILAFLCVPLLAAGACEKKSNGDTGAMNALDRAGSTKPTEGASDEPATIDTSPLQGVDVTKLSSEKQQLFYKLVGSLGSPCGKAHSLRTSYTSDATCKRAAFAVRYLEALLEDEASEAQAREEYEKKYVQAAEPVKLDVSKAPHSGNDDAPIRIVEFFDYGCPHCQAFKPQLERVMSDENGKVVEYFMMFPLEKHTDSKSAAQAALAAAKQGKFKEMHDILFEKAPAHDHEHVTEYAKQIGLDMNRFEADYAAEAPHVERDLKQGEAAGVDSTPTLFFNDRKYTGPTHPKYIEMWIDEELAVNR